MGGAPPRRRGRILTRNTPRQPVQAVPPPPPRARRCIRLTAPGRGPLSPGPPSARPWRTTGFRKSQALSRHFAGVPFAGVLVYPVHNGALGPFGWAGGVTAWGSGAGARATDGGLGCLRLWWPQPWEVLVARRDGSSAFPRHAGSVDSNQHRCSCTKSERGASPGNVS